MIILAEAKTLETKPRFFSPLMDLLKREGHISIASPFNKSNDYSAEDALI